MMARSTDSMRRSWPAAVMSLIYEPRRGSGGEPRHYPGGMQGNVAVCAAQLKGVHASIAMLCEDYALDEPRQLDFGITDVVYEWAQGESLSRVLYGTDLTGGDFVRGCKRLADVLQQIAVAGHTWVNAPKRSLRSRNRRTRTSTVASSPIQVSTEHVRNREIGFRGRPGISDTSEVFCSLE